MKRQRHAEVFDYPWCIYCGGTVLATTVDHVPARNLFDGRLRPKGMEFPSCEACNAGTKITELVAAIISRAFPDAVTIAAQQELRQLLQGVSNNVPEVLREMQCPRAKSKLAAKRLGRPNGGFLKLDGPIVSQHLDVFAAKFGFAFHFYATKRPIPIGGGTIAAIYSNVNVLDGHVPDDFITHFGPPRTLQQGVKHVGDQFKFGVVSTEDQKMTMAFASFREAIAFATFSADDASKLLVNGELPTRLFQPGDLQSPVPRPEFPAISLIVNNYPWTFNGVRLGRSGTAHAEPLRE